MSESATETTVNESTAAEATANEASVNGSAAEVEETKPSADGEAEVKEEADEEEADGMEVESSVKDSKAESEADEDDGKTYKRNGASRKRFKWLLDQGYSRNAAAQIARTPFKPKEMREKFIADTGYFKDDAWANLPEEGKKRAKWLMKNGYSPEEAIKLARGHNTNKRSGGPAKRSAEPGEALAVAVMAADYPKTLLTNEQTDEVKAAILNEVVQHKDSGTKPHFKNSNHVEGYLRIQCKDDQTRQWLEETVPKLTVPEGVSLKVMTEKNHLKGGVFTIHFPDSLSDTNETILEFINSQNDGVDVSEWTVLARREISDTKTVELKVIVDLVSVNTLKGMNYELNYKFNTLTARRVPQPKTHSTNGPNPKLRKNFNQPSRNLPSLLDSTWKPPRNTGGGFNKFNQFGGRGGGRGGFNNRNMPQSGNRQPFDFVDNLFDQLNQITGANQWNSGNPVNQWGGGNPPNQWGTGNPLNQWGNGSPANRWGSSYRNSNGPNNRNFNGRKFFTKSAFN